MLKFFPFRMVHRLKPEYAIVLVKGSNVTADSEKGLKATVGRFKAAAEVMVCFSRNMRTVDYQRDKIVFQMIVAATR
ncbi:MAG: hypothetical protein OXN21_06860 [Chloroflexota bacterium]|nr:hypothetical protein [Chloroflexota bacterium]